MKPLQSLIRHIREVNAKISAAIRQMFQWLRRSTGAAKAAWFGTKTYNAPRRSGHPKLFHTITSKIKRLLGRWNTRKAWLIVSGTAAAVATAVVLGITLGGGSVDGETIAYGNVEAGQITETSVCISPTQYVALPTMTSLSTPVPTTASESMVVALLPGCRDARIIEVQERLMELGYLGADEPTDYYGYGTEYALQLFQRKHSLQVDGILGEQTMTALFSEDAMPYTVKKGDRGTDVATIQERLKELKYFSGEITGEFGDRTETAVKNFQKRNGLYADGNVGPVTREVLFSDSARSATGSSSGGSSSGSSGSHGGGTTIATWEPDSAKVEALISVAQSLIGSRYVLGGKGPEVFDCSGFVYYCLNQAGYSIGYMTSSGWANCSLPKVTSLSDMKRGDIICFKGHVGIYLGGGQMIDASSTQGKVRICTTVLTSSYWKTNFICARRLF